MLAGFKTSWLYSHSAPLKCDAENVAKGEIRNKDNRWINKCSTYATVHNLKQNE